MFRNFRERLFYYISGIETFRLLLTTYHNELDAIEQIVGEQALGILHLRFKRFKEVVLPSVTELLSAVECTLPRYVLNNFYVKLSSC